MKVFACKRQQFYGGGLILVAANTMEDAYLTAAKSEETSHLFDWVDDNGNWCEPDWNIKHCKSDSYPLGEWFEIEELSTDLIEPKVIVEHSYAE